MSTIKEAIIDAGLSEGRHDSARRAIEALLNQSTGRIPYSDLVLILKIVSAAL